MEFADVIRRRRMVRQFEDRLLSPQTVERIVASALRAPSAGFAQGTELLVLASAQDRARFWPFVPHQVNHTPDTANAPLIVVPLAHKARYLARYAQPDKGWPQGAEHQWPAPYWYIDAGMATLMMLLSAVDEGLGAFLFWLMPAGDEDDAVPAHLAAFRAEFGIPAEFDPIGAIAIGYRAADLPPQSPRTTARRRDPRELIHRGQFGRH